MLIFRLIVRYVLGMYRRIILKFSFILLFAIGLSSQVIAQLPSARITAIFPMGCEAGNVTEVKVYGSDLEGVTGLYFSQAELPGNYSAPLNKNFRLRWDPKCLLGYMRSGLSVL